MFELFFVDCDGGEWFYLVASLEDADEELRLAQERDGGEVEHAFITNGVDRFILGADGWVNQKSTY